MILLFLMPSAPQPGAIFLCFFGLKMDLKILKPAQFIAVYNGFMWV